MLESFLSKVGLQSVVLSCSTGKPVHAAVGSEERLGSHPGEVDEQSRPAESHDQSWAPHLCERTHPPIRPHLQEGDGKTTVQPEFVETGILSVQ